MNKIKGGKIPTFFCCKKNYDNFYGDCLSYSNCYCVPPNDYSSGGVSGVVSGGVSGVLVGTIISK